MNPTTTKPLDKTSNVDQCYLSHDAFSSLYDQTYRSVFRYIYGLTGGPQQDVEDLTAETFLRAWNARRQFRGNHQQAINWLLTIAKRLVIDRWRRQKSRPVPLDISNVIVAGQDENLDGLLIRQEQFQILVELLNKLPDDKRELIVLRYILGWRVTRIADYTSQKRNTVSVTIRRILQQLHDRWPTLEEE